MHRYKYIAPGTRVGVYVFGVLRHEGIVTDAWHAREQTVISRSRRVGYAKEEPMSVFANGGQQVVELPPLSDSHPSLVLANARRLLGTPWRLTDANCEHFTHECSGVEPQSPQLQGWAALACSVAFIALLSRNA